MSSRRNSSRTAPPAASGLEARKRALRDGGLRATASRVAVLGLLESASAPLSHGDVVARLDVHGWNQATLYRNLLDLVRAGLASRADLGDHVWRFQRAPSHAIRPFDHPHFICTGCGDVACMPGLAVALRRRDGIPSAVREREVDVQIRGLCDKCRQG